MDEAIASAEAAANAADASKAASACQEAEMRVDDATKLGAPFYSVYMLSLMACGKTCEARFVWKRMPLELKEDAEAGAVHRLLQTLWTRNYNQFYNELDSFAWTSATASMVARLASKIREDMLVLVERAFSVVSLQELATLTGTSLEAAKNVATGKGWELSNETGMVTIPETKSKEQEGLKLELLEHLSEYVSILSE